MIQLSSRVRHLAMVLGAAIALAACGDRSPPPPAQEAAAPAEAASRPMLVPLPARLEQREGSFRFDAGVALGAADAAARRVAGHFAGMVLGPDDEVLAAAYVTQPAEGAGERARLEVTLPANPDGMLLDVVLDTDQDLGVAVEGIPPYLAPTREAWFDPGEQ